MERRWFIALIAFACAWFVGRAALAAPSFTYEGYLEEDAGSGNYQPVNGTRSINVEYYGNSGANCKLYQETHASVTITDGHFVLSIGKGTSPAFYGGETSLSGIQEARVVAGSSCSFNGAAANASRFLRITVAGTVMGDVAVTSAPMAMVADSVQGLGKSGILQVNNSVNLTQAKLENFMQVFTSATNQSVFWDGSSFVAFDPNDGSSFNPLSMPDSAIAGISWSKVISPPAALTAIGGLSCANGQIMKMVSGAWSCANESGGGGAESDPTVQAYAKNTPGVGLAVSSGTLAVDFGTTAGKVAQGDDARFTNSRAPNGTASGDLSGAYPNPTVTGLNGKPIDVALPLENDFLTYDSTGVKWKPTGFLKLNRQSPTGAPQALVDTYLESYNVPFLTSSTDPTIHAAHKMTSDNTTSVNNAYGTHFGALSVRTQGSVNSGITNPGGHVAGNFEAFRNTIGSNNDGGTLKTLLGGRFFIGHGTMSALSPVTQEAAGIEIGGEFNSGSVLSYKAIRISGVSGSNKPADANSYGIYQESQNMRNYFAGPVGVGTDSPSAFLHLRPGNTGAGQAQLKLTSGAMLTTPESGAVEYNGTDLYFTDSTGVRKNISSPSASVPSSLNGITSISNSSGNISLNPSAAGTVSVTAGTASLSPGSGALVVSGGVGVGGDVNVSGGIRTQSYIQALYSNTANSGSNYNSSSVALTGSYWNGSSSMADTWSLTNVMGPGPTASPTSTLTFDHTGTSGSKQYAFMSGRVGIGTLTPNASLTVTGATNAISIDPDNGTMASTTADYSSNAPLELRGSSVMLKPGGSSPAALTALSTSGGRIGVANSTPGYALEVGSSSGTSQMALFNGFTENRVNGAGPQKALVLNNLNGSSNSGTSIEMNGLNNGSSLAPAGRISSYLASQIAAAEDSVMTFSTTISGTLAERMRIHSSGNVGIGTSNPQQKLEVAGNIKVDDIYAMNVNTSNLRVSNGAGVGKVLTSDGTGNATWQAAPTNIFNPGRTFALQAQGNSSTLAQIGATAAFTANPSPIAADSNTAAGVKYTSMTTSNYVAGVLASGFVSRPSWNPIFEGHITTDTDITNVNYWVGLSSGVYVSSTACTGGSNCSDTPSSQGIAAFRYSTSAGDTTWVCYAANGTSFSSQNSAIAVNTGTTYLLRIEVTLSSIKYFVNGGLACTISSNLPGAALAMMPHAMARAISSAAKSITIHRLNVKSD